MAASGRSDSVGGAGSVGGVEKVPRSPGEWCTPGEGEGRASDKLITAMDGMEVEGE